MKSILLLTFLICTRLLSGQTFTEISPSFPSEGVAGSSIAFSDVNGDGNSDVLITGRNTNISFAPIAKLYINDGMGNFTEMTGTPFEGVYFGSIAFSDVNGDGNSDVLITGRTGIPDAYAPIAKLYINDGTGNFTEVPGTPFEGIDNSSIAFSDVNGDGHSDILMTGRSGHFSSTRIAKLYINDGTGNFTEVPGTPFEKIRNSSIAFSDVNGDGNSDVLITGLTGSAPIAKLYINDGTGNFTEMTGTPFEGVYGSSIAFSDVNGDGNSDVLITGKNTSFIRIAKLYLNDGTGDFTEVTETPFEGVMDGSIAFSDVNGDNNSDVLITGINSSLLRIAKLFINDGTGNFTEETGTPFEGIDISSIAFSDVNGDDNSDVLITGSTGFPTCITKLYINDGVTSLVSDATVSSGFKFEVYPNPNKGGWANIRINSKERSTVSIKVFDLNSRLFSQRQQKLGIGEQQFSIDVSTMNKGFYIVQLDDGVRIGVQKLLIR